MTSRHIHNQRLFEVTTSNAYGYTPRHHNDFLVEWLYTGEVPASVQIEDITRRDQIEATSTLVREAKLIGCAHVVQRSCPTKVVLTFRGCDSPVYCRWDLRRERWTLTLADYRLSSDRDPLALRFALFSVLRREVDPGHTREGLVKFLLAIIVIAGSLLILGSIYNNTK